LRSPDAAQVRADCRDLIRQHFFVFRESMPDYDPIERAEAAGKEQRRGQRKEHDELRRDRARFSRL
jgi:hypothetical protein